MKRCPFQKVAYASVFLYAALAFTFTESSSASERARRIEEEKRQSLLETERRALEGQKRFVLDYGGWSEYRFDDYTNDDNDSSATDTLDYSNSIDTRFWLKAILRPPPDASYKNVHYVYLRLREFFIGSHPSDKRWRNKQDSPIVEYAYAVVDLDPIWVEAGRHYVSIGRGLAYSDVNDAVQVFFSSPEWRFKALASRTLPRQRNIDLSVPGSSAGSDRFFYGFEGAYRGIPNHNFYSFYLIQKDDSDEEPPDDFQDYDYNSQYIGLGAHGDIIKDLHYLAEVIRENGTSRVSPSNEKAGIDAWAGMFEVAYDADIYSHPRISGRYAFGSGDRDRFSVTDTVGGNTSGIDRNFLYFGYIDTGYALAPRLSNLHFFKGTISLSPLERWRQLKSLTVTSSYYRYYKERAGGGISDTEAVEAKGYIGQEVDIEMAWQIVSDLSCAVQYGYFFAGDAFRNTASDDEKYFSVSAVLTF